MNPVIETRKLVKRYNGLEALKGIDLAIEGGGIVGILGPNGAGKTTLVEIFEGLRLPTSGEVRVLGLDPRRSQRQLKERIGAQLQTTAIAQDLTPLETLRLFASFYRRSLEPGAVLERVGLSEKARTRNRNLSGGQRQKLAIAMALINEPDLLILDEPTTGLDPMARRDIHRIVENLRQEGKTVLLTTHYIEEAEKLCDRVIMLNHGEVVADGTPFELMRRASGISTLWIAVQGEMDAAPLLRAGAEPFGKEGDYYRFHTHDPAETIIALGEMLREQQLTLLDLRLKRPTLEDVYLELVGYVEEDERPAGQMPKPQIDPNAEVQ